MPFLNTVNTFLKRRAKIAIYQLKPIQVTLKKDSIPLK
jgi:hypothetical protein